MALLGLFSVVLFLGPSYSPRRFFKALDLGSLGGRQTVPKYLNDRGEVVGYSSVSEEFWAGGIRFTNHSFRTAPGRPIDRATDDLNVLIGAGDNRSDREVSANGINNRGQVLLHVKTPRDGSGFGGRPTSNRALLIDGRRVIELEPDADPKPIAINDAGQVAGVARRQRVLPEGTRPVVFPEMRNSLTGLVSVLFPINLSTSPGTTLVISGGSVRFQRRMICGHSLRSPP